MTPSLLYVMVNRTVNCVVETSLPMSFRWLRRPAA